MTDLHAVIDRLVRRPLFWLPDRPLPLLFITGQGELALRTAERLAEPFEDCLPHASVRSEEHATIRDLIASLAGEQGQLGKPVGGSFLPPPRFPLVQFVLWARSQRDEPPVDDPVWPPDTAWPPAPNSRKGQETFKTRLKLWRRHRYGGDRGRRTAADFIGRAATTWVPVGTLAAWWAGDAAGNASDVIGVIPWVLGVFVAMIGTGVQGILSIRGSFFNGWFRRQPYLPRKRFERLPAYALRLANASEADIERLLVHAMCKDLHQAYQKWIIPWPSWGRGRYGLLLVQASRPGEVNERFLRLLEETTEETGLLLPILVLAAVPEAFPVPRRSVRAGELAELSALVRDWQQAAQMRVPQLRLLVNAPERLPDCDYRPRLLSTRLRAIGYWSVMALLIIGPATWAVDNQRDRAAHCGGLPWVERFDAECVGVINANHRTPDDLFGDKAIIDLIKKIDDNNEVVRASGRYVSVVLFGEYSLTTGQPNHAGSVAELTAMLEFQNTVSSTPRLQILIANAGVNFTHGRRAAELVRGLAANDPHVLGVVGFQRSIDDVEQAIQVLHEAKIPMVGSTGTADRLGFIRDTSLNTGKMSPPGHPSPYYFQASPTNYRQAVLAARFARERLLADLRSPSVVIVQDGSAGDQYTNNLADDYAAAFKAQRVPVRGRVYYSVSGGGLAQAAAEACGYQPDLHLYAGRATELRDYLRHIEGKRCGTGVIKVLAGDDVIKRVGVDLGDEIASVPRVEVYFTALAGRELWRDDRYADKRPAFIEKLLSDRTRPTISEDNLILTYDAVSLVYQAANTAYRAGGLPSRGDILYQLGRVSGALAWNGSGGVIDFSDSERHHPVDKAIAIMKVTRGDLNSSRSVLMVRCGKLYANEVPAAATGGNTAGADASSPAANSLCAGLPDSDQEAISSEIGQVALPAARPAR